MENIEKINNWKPIGLYDLEELYKSLLSMSTHNNHQFSLQILNNLIIKVDLIIRKFKHNPRLPLVQIEQEIIKICKKDPTTNGVVIKILFANKFGVIDSSRLSYITVNV